MTARSYLSIGDVLTLLREEFPDVTISKIRFLESQGLVNPERSPSGYRKFYETDVERLRWVLRQQREHFLPLKVIRDRLDAGDLGEEEGASSEAETHGNGRVPQPAHAAAGRARAAAPAVPAPAARGTAGTGGTGSGTGTVTAPPPSPEQSPEQSSEQSQADDQAMARILADASRRTTRVPEGADPLRSLHAIPDPAAPAPPAHAADPADPADPAHRGPCGRRSGCEQRRTRGRAVGPFGGARCPGPIRSGPLARHATPASARSSDVGCHASRVGAVSGPAGSRPRPGRPDQEHATTVPGGDAPSSAGSAGGAGGVVEASGAAGATGAAGAARGSGARAGAGRQGATASGRVAEPGAAAPREKGAGGAPGKSPGGQSAKNVGAASHSAAASEPSAEAATGASTGPASGMVTGASLTAEELCAASGLSEAELAGLQGFGLIEPIIVAGIPTFDEDALTVANLAAAFRKFGIEARHLRPYRNAVDREVGLIEQVIIPLLRQRNPESRQRAAEAADELGALGQTMRATLMRAALRRHVGG